MKRIFAFITALFTMLSLVGCQSAKSDSIPVEISAVSISSAQTEGTEDTANTNGNTPITLTIGDIVLNGYLNDSEPAKSLLAQLPLTVTLYDSDNDFCGGSLNISYDTADVQSGYKNGDLAFWTPASNFVIFVDDEESSANTGNLVVLGKITESQDVLNTLSGTLDVTIAATEQPTSEQPEAKEDAQMKIRITVGDTILYATLEDNATTRAWTAQMPLTLPMSDLYGREMCYRYGGGAMPTDSLRYDGYEVGDIAYWPPRGSLVILYAQNGEEFERQHLGHIDSGVEVFASTGNADVTFELAD